MQLLATGLLMMTSYVALGLGFALIFQTTKIFHFAFGALYAVAGYAAFGFSAHMGLSYPLAATLGILVSVLCSVLVHSFLYEPLLARRRTFLSLFITSLGVFVLLGQIIALLFGHEMRILTSLPPAELHTIAGVTVSSTRIWVFLIEAVAVVTVLLLLARSEFGLLIRAVGSESELAETLGRNLRRIRTSVVALGTALAAVSAVGKVASVGVVSHTMGLEAALIGSVAMFVGGVGSIPGAVLGGMILAVMQTLASGYISGTWSDLIVYGTLLGVILVRPAGLLGTHRIGSLD